MTSTSAPGGSNTFTWDDRGLLLTTTGPSGDSAFTYTPDGLMATRTDAAGTSGYSYDPAGRLTTRTDAASGASANIGYNTLNQPTTVGYGTGGNSRNFGYDSRHRLSSDTVTTPAGTTVASISYGYDANGNETAKTTTGFTGSATNTYTYNARNEVTSWNDGATTTSYAYDPAGNRTQAGSRTFTYNARNELTSDGSSSYTYTARGTLASTTTGGTLTTTHSDAFDQVIAQGTQRYAYDALERVVTDTTTGGDSRTLACTGTGNLVASDDQYTYGRDPTGALVGVHAAGGPSGVVAFTDQHDDLVGQFTPTGSLLAGSRTYDPLGTVLAGTDLAGNLGYQSGWTEPATGLVNMAARWYNPTVGQFNTRDSLSLDPVTNPLSANRYSYVDNNPMLTTDPSGHCPVCAPVAAGAAVGSAAGPPGTVAGAVIGLVVSVGILGIVAYTTQPNARDFGQLGGMAGSFFPSGSVVVADGPRVGIGRRMSLRLGAVLRAGVVRAPPFGVVRSPVAGSGFRVDRGPAEVDGGLAAHGWGGLLLTGEARLVFASAVAVAVAAGGVQPGQDRAAGGLGGGGQRVEAGRGGDQGLGDRPGDLVAGRGERHLRGVDRPAGGLAGGGVGGFPDQLSGGQPGVELLQHQVGLTRAQDRPTRRAGVGDQGLVLPDRGLRGAPPFRVHLGDGLRWILAFVEEGGGQAEQLTDPVGGVHVVLHDADLAGVVLAQPGQI
jgi:RHS repeat-associated protein